MALSYAEIRDIYDPLKDTGTTQEDLPTWSARMNELTGTDMYTAGLHDNIIKRASHGIDKLLEATGAPQATEAFGRSVGGLIGAPEEGAAVGRGLPRSVINFAPLLIPGAGGPITAGLRLGLTGALTGADVYEKTDSPLKALLGGGSAAAIPGIAGVTSRITGQTIGKLIGSKYVEPLSDLAGNVASKVGQYIPTTLTQKILQRGGGELAGQAAAAGFIGAEQPVEQLATGEEVTSPFTKANALGLTLGQLPFAAAHLGGKLIRRQPSPTAEQLDSWIAASRDRIAKKEAKANIENKTGIEYLPDVERPAAEDLTPKQYETARQTRLLLSQLRGEQIKIKDDPHLTDEQKIERTNELLNREFALQNERAAEEYGDTILGNGLHEDTPRQELIGQQIYINRKGTFRRIRVADDPFNPEELRGKVIGYSTKNEPGPKFGLQSEPSLPFGGTARFSLPDSQWWTVHTPEEYNALYPKKVTAEKTPELIRGPELTDEQVSAHLHELENIYNEINSANTPGDIQSAVVKLQGIEAENDLPRTNDATIKRNVSQLVDTGVDPVAAVKATVKARTRRVARQVDANSKSTKNQNERLLAAGFDQATIDAMTPDQHSDALASIKDLSTREQERAVPLPTAEEYGKVAEELGGEGFSLITADKLSHRENTLEDQPFRDLVEDTAIESARTPEAIAKFNEWFGEPNTAQYAEDFGNYLELIREFGSTGNVKPEEAAKLLNNREGTTTWDANEVKEFLERPHVQEWSKGLDEGLVNAQKVNNAFIPHQIVRPAGNRFLFSMAPYDPVTNRLGGKHTLPRDGVVPEDTFRKIGGIGKPINATELALYKQLVPEAFTKPESKLPVFDIARREAQAVSRIGDWVRFKFNTPEEAQRHFNDHFLDLITNEDTRKVDSTSYDVSVKSILEMNGYDTDRGIMPEGLAEIEPKDSKEQFLSKLAKEEKTDIAYKKSEGFFDDFNKQFDDLSKITGGESMVNIRKLDEGLKKSGPVVETKELGVTKDSPQDLAALSARQATIRHEIDTKFPNGTYEASTLIHDPNPVEGLLAIKPFPSVPQELRNLVQEYNSNARRLAENGRAFDNGSARYSFVAPKPEDQMPGYVEGLVRLPTKGKIEGLEGDQDYDRPEPEDVASFQKATKKNNLLYHGPHFGAEDRNVLGFYRAYEETLGNIRKVMGRDNPALAKWAHYPDDAKILARIEKQSDFFQITVDNGKFRTSDGKVFDSRAAAEQHNRERHPLADTWEGLVDKAFIQHAHDIGAVGVWDTDAETAMMTEGHDQQGGVGRIEYTPENSDKIIRLYNSINPADLSQSRLVRHDVHRVLSQLVQGQHADVPFRDTALINWLKQNGLVDANFDRPTLPHEKGMRLNYDQKLPSAMEKLTGQKGEVVDLGIHKSAYSQAAQLTAHGAHMRRVTPGEWVVTDEYGTARYDNEAEARAQFELRPDEPWPEGIQAHEVTLEEANAPQGSPVFKNPDGTPKTNITGRMYDIQNVPSELTLTEPNRALGTKGRAQSPIWTPTEQRDIDTIQRMGLAQGGHGILNYLAQSQNPFFASLAKDLSKFGDSLSRIRANVRDIEQGAFTQFTGRGLMDIGISPGLLRADDFSQQYLLAHELIHGLSMAEIQKPTNLRIRENLDDLRQRLVEKLPTKMRKAYDEAVSSKWYDRAANGDLPAETLMPNGTREQRNVLYGLLNTDEFLSQGLGDHNFRQYMESVKAPKGESWLHRFAATVKTLLRVGEKIPDTAFAEFLSHTDQLLQRGDYVSSFKNYAERYYENMGLNGVHVQSNIQRALGLITSDVHLYDPPTALAMLRQGVGGYRSPEWATAQRDMVRMFNERGEDAQNTQNILDEVGHKPNYEGLLDLADSLMLGEEKPDVLDTLPEPALKYILETAKDAQNIFGLLKAASQEKNKGVLNLTDPKSIRNVVAPTLKGIDNLVEQQQMHDRQVRDIQSLFTVPPDGFFQNKVLNAPHEIPEEFTGEAPKTTRDIVSRFLEGPAQISRRIPESAEAFDRGYQLRANVRNMARQALKALGMDLETMQLTPKTVKAMFKTFNNPTLRKAADRWIAENNIQGEKSGEIKVIDANDPRVQSIIGHLTPADREIVEDMVNKHSISTQHMQDQILEKVLQIASTNGGALVQRLTGYKLKDSVELAGRLLNAFKTDRSDPNAASIADAEIQLIRQKLDIDQFLTIAKFLKNESDNWVALRDHYQQNKAWSTAKRYGKYLIEFKEGNRTILDAVNSRKEAEQRAEGKPFKLTKNAKYDEDRPPSLGFDTAGIAERLRQYEQNRMDILRNTGTFDPEQLALMEKYNPSEQFITEQAYRGGVKGLEPQPRRLTKGAEQLPWLRNHVSWVHDTANYWSRQLLRAQARAHLQDPEISSNEQLRTDLKTHYENMLQPDTAFGRFFQRLAMTWFMGFNPASALINGTQPFLTHVAEFTNMTGRPLQSYRRVLGALKEVYASGLGHLEWKDPMTKKFMEHFIHDGEADISMFDDQAAGNELLHTNLVRMLSGDKPQTLGQKLGTMAGNISTTGMWMFKTVERINAMAAGIAAYKYYHELKPNMGRDGFDADAYQKAVQFHHAVNFGGGAAARPIGAFSGRGVFPRTVAMLATAMQSYNLGTIFQLARYIRSGFFRPAGLTPSEIHSARRAAVQMLGTQLAAAGVLGLPFVSGMLAVLNKAFPDLELNKKVREGMATLLGQDGENGSILSDIAMTGVPSMFGWDLQSRLSMGNTLPGVSEINGFQPENLLGAPANLVSSFVGGGMKLATGDPHAIDSFMPSALKKFEQLLRSGGQVLDYRNRPIFTPSLGEKVGITLGFNPKRLTDFNVASRIAAQTDDNIKRREGQFHQQLAGEVLKGNFGSVRQALLQRVREDKTYDPVAAVHSIAGAAEELTFPRDLRREGTLRSSDSRNRLLATFNLPPTQPTETDRLKFRQNVQRRLGVATTSPTGLQTASLMDELRRANPDSTRAELRRQATLLLRGRRLTTFSEFQE